MYSARVLALSLMVALAGLPAASAQKRQAAAKPAAVKPAAVKAAAAKQQTAADSPAPAQKAPGRAAASSERRDPFVSVIQPEKQGPQTTVLSCPAGVRGIIIGQTELNGIVKTPTGLIAVVTTSASGRTYFLREGNTLCNGQVKSISGDSVIFEENMIDAMGKTGKREVIRKIPMEAK